MFLCYMDSSCDIPRFFLQFTHTVQIVERRPTPQRTTINIERMDDSDVVIDDIVWSFIDKDVGGVGSEGPLLDPSVIGIDLFDPAGDDIGITIFKDVELSKVKPSSKNDGGGGVNKGGGEGANRGKHLRGKGKLAVKAFHVKSKRALPKKEFLDTPLEAELRKSVTNKIQQAFVYCMYKRMKEMDEEILRLKRSSDMILTTIKDFIREDMGDDSEITDDEDDDEEEEKEEEPKSE